MGKTLPFEAQDKEGGSQIGAEELKAENPKDPTRPDRVPTGSGSSIGVNATRVWGTQNLTYGSTPGHLSSL